MKNPILAEKLHTYFRGASEVSKVSKGIAIFIDCLGAVLAGLQIFGTIHWFWLPLLLFGAAVLSTICRSYSRHVRSFAHHCRRTSFRSFCLGTDIDPLLVSNVEVDAPKFSLWLASKLPAQSMDEYYEPLAPAGEKRLLELNAHSSFYTWRLLSTHALLSGIAALIIFILVFAIIYGLAAQQNDPAATSLVLEALCSIALVQLCLRATEASNDARSSATEIRKVEEALLRSPTARELLELVDNYDLERASGSDAPTLLYKLMRDRLQKQWHTRRQALT